MLNSFLSLFKGYGKSPSPPILFNPNPHRWTQNLVSHKKRTERTGLPLKFDVSGHLWRSFFVIEVMFFNLINFRILNTKLKRKSSKCIQTFTGGICDATTQGYQFFAQPNPTLVFKAIMIGLQRPRGSLTLSREVRLSTAPKWHLPCILIGQPAGCWLLIGRGSYQLMWERVSGAARRF